MPKRLSDITHVYEKTTEDLERSQDDLTRATESARVKVDAAAQARHRAYDDLYRWLRDHPDEVVVAGDWCYRISRAQIARMRVQWAHHIWVDDPAPTPAPSYRVPPPGTLGSPDWIDVDGDPPPDKAEPDPLEMSPAAEARLTAMVTAWGDVEPDAGEARTDAAMDKVRATWEERSGQIATIVD